MIHPDAYVFDLDGTLLDTIADLADAMNDALARRGFPPQSVEVCKRLVGNGSEEFVRGALPQNARDPETIAAVLEDFGDAYADTWNCKTRPFDGIPELLTELNGRGIPIAVLSNKSDARVQEAVRHYFGERHFVDVRGDRAGVPLKPDPQAALEIANALGTAPEATALVGDTCTDMRTAAAAGMVPVGVLWGFRGERELRDSGARRIVEHPRDLLAE